MQMLNKSEELYSSLGQYVFQITEFVTPILDHADGCFVFDMDGNKYLDLNSGQFCACLGHNNIEFRKTVYDQLGKIYHTNTAALSPEVFFAARSVAEVMGGDLKKTIFLSTGSEANECALRYARFITGRNVIVGINKGYHGLTLGSQTLSMSGIWARPRDENNFFIDCEDKDPEQTIKNFVDQTHNDIAAIIIEPIIAVGGMIYLTRKFLRALRQACDKYKILLIFDECQTGFGRTGSWFAFQYFGVYPDIIVCAKSMGLGIAVSSVTFAENIAREIEGRITHFSSHQNDPLSCAITSFLIETIKKENFLEEIDKKGRYFLDQLTYISTRHPLLIDPRGIGLMLAFDFEHKRVSDHPEISKKFLKDIESRGVLLQAVRRGRTFRLLPAYIIKMQEIDFFLTQLEDSLSSIEKEYNLV
jgi:4-aminobutyrate aminotransferase-like enzyme